METTNPPWKPRSQDLLSDAPVASRIPLASRGMTALCNCGTTRLRRFQKGRVYAMIRRTEKGLIAESKTTVVQFEGVRFHLVGIGGSGLSAIARGVVERGTAVRARVLRKLSIAERCMPARIARLTLSRVRR